jgi:hypothetical protein
MTNDHTLNLPSKWSVIRRSMPLNGPEEGMDSVGTAQYCGAFFHQIKRRQQIGRKVSLHAVLRRMRGLE